MLGVEIFDGFRNTSNGQVWEAATFEDYREDPTRVSIVLVKLHGSVNWRQEPDGQRQIWKSFGKMTRDIDGQTNVLIYPTQGSKPVRTEPYRTHYDCLHKCLLGARLLVVIGSSLRDPELNDEIRRGLEDNPDLHVIAVSPSATFEQVEQTIGADRAGGRIVAIAGRFGYAHPYSPGQAQNQLLMSYVHDFSRIACGQLTNSSLGFGRTIPFPVIPPPMR